MPPPCYHYIIGHYGTNRYILGINIYLYIHYY